MAEVHHFTNGWFNPGFGYLLAFVSSLLGLYFASRARLARPGLPRARWLVLATAAIGGGSFLAHFTAMLGFAVPASPLRYDVALTAASLLAGVVGVGVGLFVAGYGTTSAGRLVAGGLATGAGLLAMHYTGTAAMRVAGRVTYAIGPVAASAVIAVVGATAALWFAVVARGWRPLLSAAGATALAVGAMHYTGMAAVRVVLDVERVAPVTGVRPLVLVVSIALLVALALTGLTFVALQAMTEEEFAGLPTAPPPARHFAVSRPAGAIPGPTRR